MTIKALVSDVDGVLSDGRLWMNDEGQTKRLFHIQDGLGIKELMKAGFHFAVISGSNAKDIKKRMEQLGVKDIHIGVDKKEPVFNALLEKWSLKKEEVCYIGDDLPDIDILKEVGLAYTVPNAHKEVLCLDRIHITKKEGGQGAVREVCDYLLKG